MARHGRAGDLARRRHAPPAHRHRRRDGGRNRLPARARAATTPKATGGASATADVIVVGAGLAGLTAARDLWPPAGRSSCSRRATASAGARSTSISATGRSPRAAREFVGPTQDHIAALAKDSGSNLPDLQHGRQHLLPQRDGHPLQLDGPARPRPARPHGSRRGRKAILQLDQWPRRPGRRPVDGGQGEGVGRQTFETWKLANVARRPGASCSTSPSPRSSRRAARRLAAVLLFYIAAAGNESNPGTSSGWSTPAAARRSAASSAAPSSCRSSSPGAWATASSSAGPCAGSHQNGRVTAVADGYA